MSAYLDTKPARIILSGIPSGFYVAIVDIDDVLAEFPTVFLKYIEEVTGSPLPYGESQYGLEAAVLKVHGQIYGKKLVDNFYESTALMDLEPIEGGLAFVKLLKNLGYRLIALTGRPGSEFKSVTRDTIKWLSKYGFQFDEICFSRKKGDFVQEHYARSGNFIIGVEDHYKNAVDLARVCDIVYLRNKPNTPSGEHPKIVRFWKFPAAMDHVINTTIINRMPNVSTLH